MTEVHLGFGGGLADGLVWHSVMGKLRTGAGLDFDPEAKLLRVAIDRLPRSGG